MANVSEKIGVGLAHEYFITAQKAEWTQQDVVDLSQNEALLRQFLAVKRGEAEIVFKTKSVKEDGLKILNSKTVSAPEYKNLEAVEKALKDNGIGFGDYARQILGTVQFPLKKEDDYEWIEILVSDLGFKTSVPYHEAVAEGVRQGLEKCSPRIGIDYILSKEDKNCAIIAMDTILDSDGDPNVFGADFSGGELWLGTDCCYSSDHVLPDVRLVFARRKVSTQVSET